MLKTQSRVEPATYKEDTIFVLEIALVFDTREE